MTNFTIYKFKDDFIIHGELEIFRITKLGDIKWSFSGKDIWVNIEGKQYIFALNKQPRNGEYSFSRHEVTTGVSNDGYTEVSLCKHIQNGQKIVTDNAFYLASQIGDHGEED